MNTALKNRLLQMVAEDLRIRNELAADASLFGGYHPRMEELHRRNTAALREILQDQGWPGTDLVGEDGEEAAWVIVQHSIGEPDFMRSAFELLKEAAENKQAPLYQVALLEDRIRYLEGRLQLYGTSYDWNEEGKLAPVPGIDDPKNVDERRLKIGLKPLQESLEQQNRTTETPPANLIEYRLKMHEWAVRVGWRKD